MWKAFLFTLNEWKQSKLSSWLKMFLKSEFKKGKVSQINNLDSCLKEPEYEEQNKPKASRRKDTKT